jgi:O-antigen/teichoic acid export membrane protein
MIGKLATFAMFVAIARKLGPAGQGDITFALALTGQLLLIAGFGVDTVLVREVARKPGELGSFMGSALTLKLVTIAPALLVAAAVVELGHYSFDARVATYLIGASVAVDTLENTWNAAFQAAERLEFVSIVIVFQRLATGGLVVAVLASGAGVVPVSGTFLVVSVASILLGMWLLRFVASPEWSVDRARVVALVRTGAPVGLIVLFYTVLLRIDTVLLSLLTDNYQVGIYGAAFRLFESTMFLSWSFGSAIFPWLSRKHVESSEQLARGYEVGLGVLLSLLTPIGLGCTLLAAPVVHLLYHSPYAGSVVPLRLLGVVVIAYGVNYLTNSALTAHDRPGLMHRLLLVTLVQNLAMNAILIPPYGATGAAISSAASGGLLGTLSVWQAVRTLGHVRLRRIFAGPVAGGAAMALAVLPVRQSLWEGVLVGAAAYFAGLLLVQRAFFPEDLARVFALVRVGTRSA